MRTPIFARALGGNIAVSRVPAGEFAPGVYSCQVNVIDANARTFAFPRIVFRIK
jgi:hypothetical protein